ncbi:hypothetical protein BS78_01G214800 [Paspalum vaginatum]|nr:hypothetical protein BS78_01G214800 [Paspalum vaginatum]
MASSLQVQGRQNTGGGSRRRVVRAGSGGGGRSSAALKQLLTKLRCTWRRRATRPRRPATVSFGYDLHSYSQNFDDGHHHRLQLRCIYHQ